MGFTQPKNFFWIRWSLTPPFHPYPKAVYFLLHFPLFRYLNIFLLGSTFFCGARTFLSGFITTGPEQPSDRLDYECILSFIVIQKSTTHTACMYISISPNFRCYLRRYMCPASSAGRSFQFYNCESISMLYYFIINV